MTITVANAHDFLVDGKVELPPNAVYVGRAVKRYGLKPSVLGNPYPIGSECDVLLPVGEGTVAWFTIKRASRADVINAYTHRFLHPAIRLSKPAVTQELTRLADLARPLTPSRPRTRAEIAP